MRIANLDRFKDRHGRVRLYYRDPTTRRRIPLRSPEGSPDFWDDYHAAARGDALPKVRTQRAVTGSLNWLVSLYYQSAKFKQLEERTQKVRRGILTRFCESGAGTPYGERSAAIPAKALRRIVEGMSDRPEAANGLLKALRQVYDHGMKAEEISHNPTLDVEYLAPKKRGGHTPWTLADVEAYEAKHPIGTKARLALAILLYTGLRRSDAVVLGKQHRRDFDGVPFHSIRQKKTGTYAEIPILPELDAILDATETGDLAYLCNEWGRPYTAEGFGNNFRRWCDAAGHKGLSAHGLRKSLAEILAERGVSAHGLMAIMGWDDLSTAEIYTKRYDRKKAAADAARKMVSQTSQSGLGK